MANIELLLNPRIAPVYVAANNIIYAATVNTLTEVYPKLQEIANTIYEVLKIIYHTFVFIAHELFKEMYEYFYNYPLTTEKIALVITFYGLFLLFALNKTNNKVSEQREKINSLQKQIQLLELLQNDHREVWSDEIKIFMNQTNIKYATLDKKLKKIEKDLKSYE